MTLLGSTEVPAQPAYTLFEGGPVRPVALSPSGQRLFVANAPEAHLEIYAVSAGGLLSRVGSVPVGLEPVAVAARNDDEVWVVNHLSDSVSIVDVSSDPPRVARTLLVGDEPRDIVFAGSPKRAFITTAHRGQHREHASLADAAVPGFGDPQFSTEGIGRADVWIFDAASPGASMGVPIEIKSFFADTPRALASDGTTVYVAAFHSGNQTTAVLETQVPDGFASSCGGGGQGTGVPGPSTSVDPDGPEGSTPPPPAPETGVIVKFDGSHWVDALGCTWDSSVMLELPDHDVFALDANTLVAGSVFDHVGTILFNMVVNPTTGKLYVSNTELPNHIRFEGKGDHGGSTVQGRLSESRVSVIDPTAPPTDPQRVDPQHLNQHIDYAMLHTDAGADHAAIDAQVPHSLATPLQLVVDDANQRVYAAAFGSAKVGVFDVSELEDANFETNFQPTTQSANYLSTGGGPAGLALNATGDRLFVYTRFDNAIQVFDVSGAPSAPLQTVKMPSAEPASIVAGRRFLYDAALTSGNGEASCSSCHIFGDFDSLAWNLGDPDGLTSINNQPSASPWLPRETSFHPMKGPMTTQTLRGLSTHGATHWRGDRADGLFGTDPCSGSSGSSAPCDEEQSFMNFIVAFEGLVGREHLLSTQQMQQFTDFTLQLMLPPNPVAPLDNVLVGEPAAGRDLYFSCGPGTDECLAPFDGQGLDPNATDTVEDCDGCHNLDPANGFYGSGGEQTFENEPQNFKVAHLRNVYQKVGMFGRAGVTGPLGPQVRGFGFLHDGAVDTLFGFLESGPFTVTANQARKLEEFMLEFPSDLAPVVGQQVSLGPSSPDSTELESDANDRVDRLDQQAGTAFTSLVLGGMVTECDLIVKTVEGGVSKGYLRQSDGNFLPDDGEAAIPENQLRAKAAPGSGQDLQFSCVPPGSGQRMGIDRDEDSVLDGLDNCPAWPNGAALGSCTAGDAALLASACTSAAACGSGGVCSQAQQDADSDGTGDACEPALLPEPAVGFGFALGWGLLAGLRRRGSRVR